MAVTQPGSVPVPQAQGSDASLGPIITARYGFPEPVRVRRLGDGLGATYLVQAPGRQAVARLNDPSLRPAAHFAFELELLARLDARGLPVAGPCRLVDGTLFAALRDPGGERQLALYRFLPGRQPRLAAETCWAMGRLLAEFHVAAESLVPSGAPPVLGRASLLERPLIAVKARLADSAGEEASVTLDAVAGFLARSWPEGPPEPGAYGLVHGDAHHLNFRDDQTGQLALFDFEHVALGWRAYDLATLIWGSFGRGGNAALWDAMVRGYSSFRRLGEREARTVPVFVALRQLWWMGFHSRHWGRWRRPWLSPGFFPGGVELLRFIAVQTCGYRGG